jgi:hypothetical protein
MTHFNLLSQNFSGQAEVNHEISVSVQLEFEP